MRSPMKWTLSILLLPALLNLSRPLLVAGDSKASAELSRTMNKLLTDLGSSNAGEAATAYKRLNKMGKQTVPFMLARYEKSNFLARGLILRLIQEFKPASAKKLLIKAVKEEEDTVVRGAAAKALLKVSPEDREVLELMTKMAKKDYESYVRLVVANAMLDSLSSSWRKVMPFTIKLLKDDTPDEIRKITCRRLRYFVRKNLPCEAEKWDEWWVNNQDIFKPRGKK